MVISLQGMHPKTRFSIQRRVLPTLLTVGRSRVLVPSMLVVAVLDDTVTQVIQVVVFNAERSEF